MDGLSVASSHESAKQAFQRGKGVAALEISAIQFLNLRVIHGDDDHGYIDGLPYDTQENYDQVMEFAERLVALSRVTIDPWPSRL